MGISVMRQTFDILRSELPGTLKGIAALIGLYSGGVGMLRSYSSLVVNVGDATSWSRSRLRVRYAMSESRP